MVNEVENSISEIKKGESLMAQRVLFRDRTLEPCQRSNLFKTHCKSGGKVCNVIVDSGSTNNLVVEQIVQKLDLNRVKHTCPYKIGRL